MYKYLIYGIGFYSDFKIYNLTESNVKEDVSVISGSIDYGDIAESKRDFYFSKDFVTFRTKTDSYAIKNGKTIIVEKGDNSTEVEISAIIIGWCMAFLFLQRGYTTIHCTALNINNHGVLVSGISGAGKSTTASELIRRNHKFLVDDMAVINPQLGMEICPAYPLQKLCANEIADCPKENLLYINEDRDKYSYLNTKDYCPDKVLLEYLFCLDIADVAEIKIEKITGLNSYMQVLSCMYLAEIYSFKGTPEEEKYRCLKIAENIKVYKITRPKEGNSVKNITDAIEKIVRDTEN